LRGAGYPVCNKKTYLEAAPMRLRSAIAAAAILSACGGPAATAPAAPSEATSDITLKLTPVAEGLEFPWGMAFLPGGDLLVTEREGNLRIVRDGALDPDPIGGLPPAFVEGQGGLLGLALDPNFADNRYVYFSQSEGTKEKNATVVSRGVYNEEAGALENVETVFASTEKDTPVHFGGRLEFIGDGTLLVTLGDGFSYMDKAQETDNYLGKIVRVQTNGLYPDDNPFADGPAPGIFTYGHRNVQGIEYDPATGTIWAHEHGPKGGDEVNILKAGNNYGWPKITYGVNYNGSIISNKTEMDGMEQPEVKWVPSIAPSGMLLYTGDKYPGWSGDLFVGAMNGPAGQKLVRLDVEGGKIVGQEDLLTDEAYPIRDVIQGPDGYIYIATHELDGTVFRLDVE